MYMWYINIASQTITIYCISRYYIDPNNIMVRKFSDILCKCFEDNVHTKLGRQQTLAINTNYNSSMKLQQIRRDDSATHPPTRRQIEEGCKVGTGVNSTLFYLCRKYCLLRDMLYTNMHISAVLFTRCHSVKKTTLIQVLNEMINTS